LWWFWSAVLAVTAVVLVSPVWSCGVCVGAGGGGGGAAGCCLHKWVWVDKPLS